LLQTIRYVSIAAMTIGIEAPRARPYRGVAKDERCAERRRRLIEAGIQVFGRETYHRGTVRAVCAAAGLTERYFYESFLNREQLLRAIYDVLIDGLHRQIEAALAAPPADPASPLRAVLAIYFDFVEANQPGARILLFEVMGISDEFDARYRRAMRGFAVLLLRAVGGLRQAGPLTVPDEELVADGLIGAVVHMAQRWVLGGYRQSRADIQACAQAIVPAVVRELRGGTEQTGV
jgi:AcrR family transcriptional regulator